MSYGGSSGGSGKIATAADAALSNPAQKDVLTYDASVQKWKNSPLAAAAFSGSYTDLINKPASSSGGASMKTVEDAHRAIWAIAPSAESGLSAVYADASHDDAARLQAMLTYLKSTYGGGQLFLPSNTTSNVNAGLTIPAGVQVVGMNSRWDFWFAGSAVTAVTINDNDFTPIIGVRITGNQYDANASSHNTTTSTGINLTGHGLNFVDMTVGGFNWGIDFTNDNTYIIAFERCSFIGNMISLNLDLSNTWNTGSGPVSNSGERIALTDCVIANCGMGYQASGDGCGLFLTHVSIDFTTMFGRQANAHVFFSNCHLETTGSGATYDYLIDLSVNSRLLMTNCSFILGSAGIYRVLNTGNGPWNYGTGHAHFTGCDIYANMPSGATSAGAVGAGYSEAFLPVPTGSTTMTIYSPFVSKWSAAKVAIVATDGNVQTNVSARITGMNIANGTITVTFSAATPAGTFIEIDV